MDQKQAIAELVAGVLDGTELHLRVDAYRLEEVLESDILQVRCDVHDERTGHREIIEGQGVGIVDAMFQGLIRLYSEKFPSLKSIRFADFSIHADLDSGRRTARSDMAAKVTLRVANSEDNEFVFVDESPSITRSSLAVVLQAVEFFINSERAFVALYRALQHARAQNRADSIELYTAQLSTLVEATSYSEVIAQIRKTELGK
jgi:hypothetical protein